MPSIAFDPPRDLTPEERDVLDFVIDANARYSDKLRALFADSKVTHECDCGCGTISLTTTKDAVEARTWPSPLPIDVRSTESVTVEGRHPEDKEWFRAMLFANLTVAHLRRSGVPIRASRSLRSVHLSPSVSSGYTASTGSADTSGSTWRPESAATRKSDPQT